MHFQHLLVLIHFACKVPTAGEGGAFDAFLCAHVSGGLVVLPGAGSGEPGADAGIGGIVPVLTEGAFFPNGAVHLDVYEGPHWVSFFLWEIKSLLQDVMVLKQVWMIDMELFARRLGALPPPFGS